MNASLQAFLFLLLAGLFLLGAEIYIPGGVVGSIGALALLGAMIMGFFAFGAQIGFFIAVLIILLTGIIIVMWVRYFPRTGMGRKLTLSQDGKDFKAATDYQSLLHCEGEAQSDLRPSGIAHIDGRRVDVVADGSYISARARLIVTSVEGNRILVRELQPSSSEKAPDA